MIGLNSGFTIVELELPLVSTLEELETDSLNVTTQCCVTGYDENIPDNTPHLEGGGSKYGPPEAPLYVGPARNRPKIFLPSNPQSRTLSHITIVTLSDSGQNVILHSPKKKNGHIRRITSLSRLIGPRKSAIGGYIINLQAKSAIFGQTLGYFEAPKSAKSRTESDILWCTHPYYICSPLSNPFHLRVLVTTTK